MAPPLLPTTRLTVCPACAEHVKRAEERCPHCGAALGEARASSGAAAVLIGLALTGCPDKEPDTTSDATTSGATDATDATEPEATTVMSTLESDYGVATSEDMTTPQTGTTSEPTTTATGTGTATGETGETATDPTVATSTAESDYGSGVLED